MNKSKEFTPKPYLLRNKIQNYSWGTRGRNAYIPRLLGFSPQGDTPYAELWIGAHPKAPSEVLVEGNWASLLKLIDSFPRQILGETVTRTYGPNLPFLFKVLSIGQALSIQLHPDLKSAAILHQDKPEHYPDSNHKPEVAIALNKLSALMGLKPYKEINETVRWIPELGEFIGDDILLRLRSEERLHENQNGIVAREYLTALIYRAIEKPDTLRSTNDSIRNRLSQKTDELMDDEQLFVALYELYGNEDVGLLAMFLMNLVYLEAGQGVYIGAGIPHAYLAGNIVECMANSDNVVRMGLTPKFKDTKTLVEILDFDAQPQYFLNVESFEDMTYETPAPEFQVNRIRLDIGDRRILHSENAVNIYLVISGDVTIQWGVEAHEMSIGVGESVLIPASLDEISISSLNQAEIFRASVPGSSK